MPKTTKPSKKSSPPKSGPKKVKSSPKKVEPQLVEPVVVTPEPVVVVAPPATPKPTSSSVTDSIFNDLQAELTKLADAGVQIPALKKALVTLKKSVDKERKELAKAAPKKRAKSTNANKGPSGFAKPAPISKELASFLGEKPDTLVARTAVTRFITQYIKEHNLQNPENKRHILADTKLKKLLKVTDKDEVTYFNLQKWLKIHYPSTKPVAA